MIAKLHDRGLINPPEWLVPNTHCLMKMGSNAYGIANKNSDIDIYGFCIPPLEIIFPHVAGYISGFGRQVGTFDQFQQEHVVCDGQEYDLNIYNIVKFFNLCMDNNPNMIDCLFVPKECIIYQSSIAELIFQNRELFLHKGSYHRFLGYAGSQWKKIRDKNPIGKRKAIVDKYKFDVKYGSHLYRLANECEQILKTGTLNLREASSIMGEIRNGLWSLDRLEKWFIDKEIELKSLYETSSLQYRPEEQKIKNILVKCLEMQFGNLNQFGFNY